jgi:hypothetical protein
LSHFSLLPKGTFYLPHSPQHLLTFCFKVTQSQPLATPSLARCFPWPLEPSGSWLPLLSEHVIPGECPQNSFAVPHPARVFSDARQYSFSLTGQGSQSFMAAPFGQPSPIS